jgi:protein gp37
MADQRNKGIAWTETTWNPIRGCTRVSEGCRHCYAERVAARFSGPGKPYEGLANMTKAGPRWTGEVRMVPEHLTDPLRWKRPRMVFVNSMSDLFHEELTFVDIAAIFGVMAAARQHTFQVLTKRPERARKFFEELPTLHSAAKSRAGAMLAKTHALLNETPALGVSWTKASARAPEAWPLANVWLGTSVEDQAAADERIPALLECPAAVRFVSYEPALSWVNFTHLPERSEEQYIDALRGETHWTKQHVAPRSGRNPRLDWIIVGGESGPGARPFDIRWARWTAEQCKAAGVACFVKQLGAQPTDPSQLGKAARLRLRDRKGGDPLEWPVDLRVREWPAVGPSPSEKPVGQ